MRLQHASMRFGKRAVACVAAFVLASAMMPVAAFAQAGPESNSEDQAGAIPYALASTQQAADDADDGVLPAGDAAYVEGEILVTFNGAGNALGRIMSIASVPEADEAATIEALDFSELGATTGEPIVVKLDDDADEVQAVRDAQALPNVHSAQLNYRYYLDDVSDPAARMALTSAMGGQAGGALTNDPAVASFDPAAEENAWHLKAIDIESAWAQVKCEGSVTVAVLDTGCDMAHEDLADNVLVDYAWNAYKGEPLSCDYYGHGTHVAGCIAATANNGTGTAGSSYNAKILPINVFDAYGSDQWSSTTKALVSAYDYLFEFDDHHPELNLHVVNMSLGGYGTASADDVALQQRIKAAKERDIVSVCAGGNGVNGISQTDGHYPSDYDDSFGVTALSKDGYCPTSWCDRNAAKDICTPGEDIYSTVPMYCKMSGNANWWSYEAVSGTSMATPITAGVFALLWSVRPDLTVDEAVEAVKKTASDRLQFPSDDWYMDRLVSDYGAGILSAGDAVAYARKLPPNANTRAALAQAAQEGLDLLGQATISVDGADVPTTGFWVSHSVYDALLAAAVTARDTAAIEATYAEVVSARDNLAKARGAFEVALAPGSMRLADASAKNDLRRLARNAKLDMDGVVESADGSGLAAGTRWVTSALAKRLSDAIDAAGALASEELAGQNAVAACASELSAARAAYNAGIKTVAVPAKPVAKAVVINKATVTASVVKKALAAANNAGATKITLGAKVKKISKKAFSATKAKTIVVKTKKLKKSAVKGALKSSKVKTIIVKVGTAKVNKQYVAKYKKLFVKNVAGKKATVKA